IVVEIASDLLGWDAAYLHLYSREDHRIIPILTIDTVNGKRVDLPSDSFELNPTSWMTDVMKNGARLIDRETLPEETSGRVRFGDMERVSASALYVPIRDGAKALGILSIQSYSPKAYDEEALSALQAI